MTQQDQPDRSLVVEGRTQPAYEAVAIPAIPPTEYGYKQRRAELVEQIRNLGHPSMIHQGEAAERYGVSQQQISKDLDRIAESVSDNLGARHELGIDAVFQRTMVCSLEECKHRQAAMTAKEYREWLTEQTEIADI